MTSTLSDGWTRESDELFLHASGSRIVRTTYQGKAGWFLMPADLTRPVQQFPPTESGREKAFAAFERLLRERPAAAPKPVRKPSTRPRKRTRAHEDE